MDRRLCKVSYDGKVVKLRFEVQRPDGAMDKAEVESADQPTSGFQDALQALRPHVCELLEVPAAWGHAMTIRGVTISWASDANSKPVWGAVVTCLRKLADANAPLVINTPHLPSSAYSGDEGNEPVLPAELADAIQALVVHAWAYVDGERLQLALFGDKKGKKSA